MKQNKLTLFFVVDGLLGLECLRHLSPNQVNIIGALAVNEKAHDLIGQSTLPLFVTTDDLPDLSSIDYILSTCQTFSPLIEKLKKYNKPIIEYCEASTPNWITSPIPHAILKQNMHYYTSWITRKNNLVITLQKQSIHIKPDETAQSLIQKTIYKASQSLPHLFENLLSNKAKPLERIIYSPKPVTYINSLISWDQSAEEIERLCRALHYGFFINPYACAKFIFKNKVYIPIQITLCNKKNNRFPGEIVAIKKKYIQISTATTDLRIFYLKTLHGTLFDAKDFSDSINLKIGDRLPSFKKKDLKFLEKTDLIYCQSEEFWSHTLSSFNPTRCPYFETKDKLSYSPIIIKKSISEKQMAWFMEQFNKEKIEHIILTIFLIYIYNLDENNELCIALQNKYQKDTTLSSLLYNDTLPTKFYIEVGDTFQTLLIRTKLNLNKQENLTSYKKDIFLRYPELSSTLKDWSHNNTSILIQISSDLKKLTLKKNSCLTLVIEEKTGNYAVSYNTNLLKKKERSFILEKIAYHLSNIIESIILDPNQNFQHLSILDNQEKKILTQEWNNTQHIFQDDSTLLFESFIDKAYQMPHKTAVIADDGLLSYQELLNHATQLAHQLRLLGAVPNTLVAIYLPKSIYQAVAVLGIVMAGAAYLPISVDEAEQRVEHILNEGEVKIILTHSKFSAHLKQEKHHLICLDKISFLKSKYKNEIEIINKASDLAYVIFTSGSTGIPKGVMIEHAAALNTVKDITERFSINEKDIFYGLSNLNFDLSVYDLFGVFSAGATLVLPSEDARKEPAIWVNDIIENQVTIWNTVPALMQMLCDYILLEKKICLNKIRLVLLSGDWISLKLPEQIHAITSDKVEVISLGGATEASIWSILYPVNFVQAEWNSIPYGQPMWNQRFYILNNSLKPIPIGVTGDLYIAGLGLARGYWKDDIRTKASFIIHPITQERLYKTGDLGRYNSEGIIEFQGRKDHQIKIHGYRVELGEIESTILNFPSIKECVVILKQENQKKYLTAYMTINGMKHSFNTKKLRDFLEQKIPGYMIPNVFVLLDKIPLTSNLKINKDALIKNNIYPILPKEKINPKNELEKKITAIYSDIFSISKEKISLNEDFFSLGGDSIIAMQIISRCNQEGIPLTIKDLFTKSSIQTIVNYLIEEKNLHVVPNLPLTHEELLSAPIAPVQNRLYIVSEEETGNPFYNVSFAYRFSGKINIATLTSSLHYLVQRHTVLRSYITIDNDLPIMKFLSSIPENNILTIHKVEKDDLSNQLFQIIHKPFDLKHPPLFRFDFFSIKEDQHILLINIHHIITDGWSMDIFNRELSNIYNSLLQKKEPKLTSLSIQYSDFAIWQKKYLTQEKINTQLNYWKAQLKDISPLNLPLDYPHPKEHSFQGKSLYFKIDKGLSYKLKALSKEKKTTLFNLIYTALLVLLYRYTGQEDITIGTPTAGRPHKKTEDLIGFFANTLVLRNHLENKKSFLELLLDNQNKLIDAFLNQDVPFEQVVSAINPERMQDVNPLFRVLLGVEPQTQSHPNLEKIMTEIYPLDFQYTLFDLSLYLENTTDNELSGKLQFSTNLFKSSKMERFIVHLINLLSSIVDNPEVEFRKLELLTLEEIRLFNKSNNTPLSYDKQENIINLLNLSNFITSDKIAIITNNKSYSYKTIHERSNQLAHYILSFQLPENSLIAIWTEKSIETVISILAVLKAGHAYLPIDPIYPIKRIEYMLQDSHAQLILTQQNLISALPFSIPTEKIILLTLPDIQAQATHLPNVTIQSNDLAYVIYTSGSTGNPKGVMITHDSLTNFIHSFKHFFSEKDYLLSLTTPSFDIFGLELFLPLSIGAKIYLATSYEAQDPTTIISIVNKEKINIVQATPTAWQMLLQLNWIIPSYLTVLIGGEKLSLELAKKLLTHNERVFNLYGPTETTIWSTFHQLTPNDLSMPYIPVGKPIANTQIYILDNALKRVPIGVPGELHIAGKGLAHGYLNQPSLTAEKFIENPYHPGELFYKTGDIAYWGEDGNIYCIGRNDNQIKLRGYRIDIGEIESTFEEIPYIKKALVIQNTQEKESNLLAYIQVEHQNALKMTDNLNELVADQIQSWKEVWNHAYINESIDPYFNYSGWINSVTKKPYSFLEMNEWINHTIESILRFSPQHVIEIGCGSGMLLFKLLPHIESYYGTDISNEIVMRLNALLSAIQKEKVRVETSSLENLPTATLKKANMIIFNSVIQYFPSASYLKDTIFKLIDQLPADSTVFLGDIINLDLMHFYYLLKENRMEKIDINEIYPYLKSKLSTEEELFLSPDYFLNEFSSNKNISEIYIEPKCTYFKNEMSLFRFNVILKIKSAKKLPSNKIQEFEAISNLNELEITLKMKNKALLIKHIPISSLYSLRLNYLNGKNITHKTLDFFEIKRLAGRYRYHSMLTYSQDSFHVSFLLYQNSNIEDYRAIFSHPFYKKSLHKLAYSNPLYSKENSLIKKRLLAEIKQYLPSFMIPSKITLIDKLPLLPNGKIDKKSLKQIDSYEIKPISKNIQHDEIYSILSSILGHQNIDENSTFFDLGGNSLLAIKFIQHLKDRLHIAITPTELINHQIIKQLHELILARKNNLSKEEKVSPLHTEFTLFLLPPANGSGLLYQHFISLLKIPYRVITLQDPYFDKKDQGFDSVDELSHYYIEQIHQQQPKGSYLLGGFSFAGMLAVNIAEKMKAQGNKIEEVLLFDTWAVDSKKKLQYSTEILEATDLFIKNIQSKFDDYHLSNFEEHKNLMLQRLNLLSTHSIPDKLSVPLTLFKAKDYRFGKLHSESNFWEKHTNNIKTILIPGSHETLFESPYVEQLAKEVNISLSKENF